MVNIIHPSGFSLHRHLVIVLFAYRFDNFLSPCIFFFFVCVLGLVWMMDSYSDTPVYHIILAAVIDGVSI